KIFASYSHRDREIVEQIEHHIQALGDKYLRDVTELRSGQDWQRWMKDAISEADVFQLFWSHNAMRSAYVREEWEYALALARPIYWETPLPESPTENLPPEELRRLHFQHLRPSMSTHPAGLNPTVIEATSPAPSAISAPTAATRSASAMPELGIRGGEELSLDRSMAKLDDAVAFTRTDAQARHTDLETRIVNNLLSEFH